jgi:hypothetical protein
MSQAGVIDIDGGIIPSDVPIDFVTNSGTATASGNVLNVIGGTTGSGNTINVFAPNAIVTLFDDFIGAQQISAPYLASNYGWNMGQAGPTNNLDNGHPGLILFTNGNFNSCYLFLDESFQSSITGNSFILGGGKIVINWVFNIAILSSLASRYILQIGMGDTQFSDQANGIYFEYSDNENSGNWIIKTASASTRTTTDTAIAVTTGWHNAQMTINTAASSVNFTMDGVSLGNITTHIPTTSISPFMQTIADPDTTPATALVVYADLFYLIQTLTTAR